MKYKSMKLTHTDGRMHHLGIRRDDIAPNILLPQTADDVIPAAALLDDAEKRGEWREYLTYTGSWKGTGISVISSGMGCMPMAIAVEELKHLGARNMIRLGTGSAIQEGIKPGTLFISASAVRGEGATLEYINYRYPAVADITAINALIQAAGEYGEKPIVGMFLSHDAVYLNKKDVPFWRERKVDLIDSETSSLLTISSLLRGLRVVSLCVASENYTDGTSIEDDVLGKRIETAGRIAIRALHIMAS